MEDREFNVVDVASLRPTVSEAKTWSRTRARISAARPLEHYFRYLQKWVKHFSGSYRNRLDNDRGNRNWIFNADNRWRKFILSLKMSFWARNIKTNERQTVLNSLISLKCFFRQPCGTVGKHENVFLWFNRPFNLRLFPNNFTHFTVLYRMRYSGPIKWAKCIIQYST